jgi:hypothetical protein
VKIGEVECDRNGGQRKEGTVYIEGAGAARASQSWRGQFACQSKSKQMRFLSRQRASDCVRGRALSGQAVVAMQNHGVL